MSREEQSHARRVLSKSSQIAQDVSKLVHIQGCSVMSFADMHGMFYEKENEAVPDPNWNDRIMAPRGGSHRLTIMHNIGRIRYLTEQEIADCKQARARVMRNIKRQARADDGVLGPFFARRQWDWQSLAEMEMGAMYIKLQDDFIISFSMNCTDQTIEIQLQTLDNVPRKHITSIDIMRNLKFTFNVIAVPFADAEQAGAWQAIKKMYTEQRVVGEEENRLQMQNIHQALITDKVLRWSRMTSFKVANDESKLGWIIQGIMGIAPVLILNTTNNRHEHFPEALHFDGPYRLVVNNRLIVVETLTAAELMPHIKTLHDDIWQIFGTVLTRTVNGRGYGIGKRTWHWPHSIRIHKRQFESPEHQAAWRARYNEQSLFLQKPAERAERFPRRSNDDVCEVSVQYQGTEFAVSIQRRDGREHTYTYAIQRVGLDNPDLWWEDYITFGASYFVNTLMDHVEHGTSLFSDAVAAAAIAAVDHE